MCWIIILFIRWIFIISTRNQNIVNAGFDILKGQLVINEIIKI